MCLTETLSLTVYYESQRRDSNPGLSFFSNLEGSNVKNQSWDTSSEQLETKLRLAEISGVVGARARSGSAARERENATYGK